MEYETIKQKARNNKLKRDLIHLYLKSKTFSEFKLNAVIRFGYSKPFLLNPFARYYYKNTYPVLYHVCWLFSFFANFIACGVLGYNYIPFPNGVGLLCCLFPVIAMMIDISTIGKWMKDINWYERGCPIEY